MPPRLLAVPGLPPTIRDGTDPREAVAEHCGPCSGSSGADCSAAVTHWSTEDALLSSCYLNYLYFPRKNSAVGGVMGLCWFFCCFFLSLPCTWMILLLALEQLQARGCCNLCCSLLSIILVCKSCAGVKPSVHGGNGQEEPYIQIALPGKGTSASCLFSLFNLIFKLKLFYSFSYPC